MTKIGIIGRGLMGGSIYKGLKGAVLLNGIEQISEVDLLILAVPISAILEIGEKIASLSLKRSLLVLDIGSVKGLITEKFEEWTHENIEFLATHPMAGTEQRGYEHSNPTIFQGAVWAITPHAKNSAASIQRVEGLIRELGAEPMQMDAREHDRRAALISQLPYLLSKTLFDFVDPASLAMAGPGFKSMVRLARDNPEMRGEIARYNRDEIFKCLKGYINALQELLE